MNKDVIYIDVEDDITAIIGKVKDSKEKIVALVPPKRIGLLQSAVNLRLLGRTAENGKKRLVLITNNHALMALAASAKIPVAKNLQSKPELPEIAALDIDDGEDIIDGSQLPIGEHAKMATGNEETTATDAAAEEIIAAPVGAVSLSKTKADKKGKNKNKVPNFNKFRKRLVFIIIGIVLLIGFLVWAIFFAPRATVVITARTTPTNVNQTVKLGDQATTDFTAGTIKSVTQQKDDPKTISFKATGEENRGKIASGSVNLSAKKCGGNPFSVPSDVPAGTVVGAGSSNYTTQEATSFSGSSASDGCFIYSSNSPTAITASKKGEDGNVSNGSFTVSGRPDISGTGSASGGTDDIVKIVTAGDVQAAKKELADSVDSSVKDELTKAFPADVIIITDSFKTAISNVDATPAIGDESSGDAKLTATIAYSMTGVAKSDLDDYLKAAIQSTLDDQATQRVYDSGREKVKFSDFSKKSDEASVTVATTGQLGPKIDDNEIKDKVKGKQFGAIQSDLEAINGVDSAETKFFPFWVNTVPDDVDKITIEFKLDES